MACLQNNRIAMSCDGAPNLAFAVIDRHAYFYKTQNSGQTYIEVVGRRDTTGALEAQYRVDKDWIRPQEFRGRDAKGNLYCLDEQVLEIKKDILEQCVVFKISMKDEVRIKTMKHKT